MESNVNKALYKGIRIAATVLIVLLVVIGTFRASYVAYDFGYRVFTEPAMESKPGTNVIVTIDETMDIRDIADYLLEEGLIRDANLFWLQYQLSAYKGKLIPGTYSLNTAMTAKEMMVVMAAVEEDTDDESESSDVSDDTVEEDEVGTAEEAE